MDEDITIINTNTRNERIKNFFINNKNKLITFLISVIIISILFFGYGEYKKNEKIEISNLYNSTIIDFSDDNKKKTTDTLIQIVNKKTQLIHHYHCIL